MRTRCGCGDRLQAEWLGADGSYLKCGALSSSNRRPQRAAGGKSGAAGARPRGLQQDALLWTLRTTTSLRMLDDHASRRWLWLCRTAATRRLMSTIPNGRKTKAHAFALSQVAVYSHTSLL